MKTDQNFTGFAPADQPNPRALPVNTVLAGKYLVGKVLGQGGFGITYIGYDLNMQTRIAVKEYFPVELVHRNTTIAASDRAISLNVQSLGGEKTRIYQQGLEKYIAEARQVSKFADVPGVVSVKDFFYENQTAYIVMEYIDGISLKDYLKKKSGKLSEEETLFILNPVLKALKEVHRAGIVHRDISPDNIMLTFENEKIASVKLIDFGAARMTSTNDQKSLTIILKHGYAPEEQYRTHGDQGPWTDVYAICATMYRMLTGKTPESSMDRILTDQLPSIKEQGIVVSKNVEAAILAGLGVKKQDRIASIEELSSYLYEGKKVPARYAHASKGQKKGGSFAQTKSRRNTAMAIAAAAVLLLSAGGVWLFTSDQTNVPASGQQTAGQQDGQETAGMENSVLPENQSQEILSGTETSAELQLSMEPQTKSFTGKQIAFPKKETLVACGSSHILAIQEDGTVVSYGNNAQGQCDTQDWRHIVAVTASDGHSAGLCADGTVKIAGSRYETSGSTGVWDAESWTDIVAISLAPYGHILGLKSDGTVVAAGDNSYGCCEVGDWTDIVAIAAGAYLSVGIKEDGTILVAGGDPQYCDADVIRGWTDIQRVWTNGYTIYGQKKDGSFVVETKIEKARRQDFLNSLGSVEQFALIGDNPICTTTKDADGLHFAGENAGFRHGLDAARAWDWSQAEYLYGGQGCMAALFSDGTVKGASIRYGESSFRMSDFGKLKQIAAGRASIAGVTTDGQVQLYEVSSTIDLADLSFPAADAVYIEEDANETYILFSDGTVGRTVSYKGEWPDTAGGWDDIQQVVNVSGYLFGLRSDHTIVYQDMLVNGADWRPQVLEECKAALNWKNIKQLQCCGQSLVGLTEDGQVLTTDPRLAQKLQEQETEALQIAGNFWGCLALVRPDGTVAYFENNDQDSDNGRSNVENWTDITQVAVSQYHTVGLKKDGTVVACGKNNNGMCQVDDWEDIVSIAVSESCTLGLTLDGSLKMAGLLDNDWENAPVMTAAMPKIGEKAPQ